MSKIEIRGDHIFVNGETVALITVGTCTAREFLEQAIDRVNRPDIKVPMVGDDA